MQFIQSAGKVFVWHEDLLHEIFVADDGPGYVDVWSVAYAGPISFMESLKLVRGKEIPPTDLEEEHYRFLSEISPEMIR